MKYFAIFLACLAALVSVQARKTWQTYEHSRKAITDEQTVDDIMSDVPDAGESNIDDKSSYKDMPAANPKDFDPTAALNEDVSVMPFQGPSGAQDISIEPSSGMSGQGTGLTTLEGLEAPMEDSHSPAALGLDASLPIVSLHEDSMEKAIVDRTNTKKSQSETKSKEALSSELESIESTVLHLADKVKKTGKADDTLLNMTRDINKILDEIIIPDLISQYKENVDSVFEAVAAVDACVSGPDHHYNPKIQLSDYQAEAWDRQHYECRQEQFTTIEMEEKWERACEARKDRCQSLNNSWNQENYNVVDWKECVVDPGKYHGSLWLEDYYGDQENYWKTLWSEMNTTRSYVQGNCTLWEECEANLTVVKNNSADAEVRCNDLQAKMDAAYCHYKEDIDSQWDLYTNCCKTTSGICPVTREKAINNIAWLDSQYRAIERIKCYMYAFPTPNLESELHKCREAVIDTTYQGPLPYWDGSMPTRVYPPVPTNSIKPFPECPVCPQALHECGDQMPSNYTAGAGINPDNSRYESMDDIPGTPAYGAVHYRPPAVRHLCVDCAASCCPNKCR